MTEACQKFAESASADVDGDGDSCARHVHVLDIGAGTGLLSMMAAEHAKHQHPDVPVNVTAFEVWQKKNLLV